MGALVAVFLMTIVCSLCLAFFFQGFPLNFHHVPAVSLRFLCALCDSSVSSVSRSVSVVLLPFSVSLCLCGLSSLVETMIDIQAAIESLRTGEEAARLRVVDELGRSGRAEAITPLLIAVA